MEGCYTRRKLGDLDSPKLLFLVVQITILVEIQLKY